MRRPPHLDVINLKLFRCKNQANCRIPVNAEALGDPCPGTRKYFKVGYECVKFGECVLLYCYCHCLVQTAALEVFEFK